MITKLAVPINLANAAIVALKQSSPVNMTVGQVIEIINALAQCPPIENPPETDAPPTIKMPPLEK